MIPSTLRKKLSLLRFRERCLELFWGASRFMALTLGLLIVACAVDWAIDRERDTPVELRRFLSYFQVAVAVAAGIWFLVWPLRNRLTDAALALRVEERMPQFKHRLISAVQ